MSRDSVRVHTLVWRGRRIEPYGHASGTSEAGPTMMMS